MTFYLIIGSSLTPRVKPSVIQSFVTLDFMERSLKCDHLLAGVEKYFTVVFVSFSSLPSFLFWKICQF